MERASVVFFLVLLLSAAGFAAGLLVSLKRPKWRIWLLPLCGAAIAFRALLVFARPMDVQVFPFDAYAVVESWWVYPFGALLFGSATAQVKSVPARDLLLIAEGLALVYFGLMAWLEAFTDLDKLDAVVDTRGRYFQSSLYSCGPAAAASFLHSYGIETTEREMAGHCWTSEYSGTTLSGLVRGLARKLPEGRKAIGVGRLNIAQLQGLRRPALVIIETPQVNHWIVVDEIGPDYVFVRDPSGRDYYEREEFEKIWTGLAVWAQPR
jgi:hypothetical protein